MMKIVLWKHHSARLTKFECTIPAPAPAKTNATQMPANKSKAVVFAENAATAVSAAVGATVGATVVGAAVGGGGVSPTMIDQIQFMAILGTG